MSKGKWKLISSAPKDGTPILACCVEYEKEFSMGGWPTTISWRTFHPNSPGQKCWRDSSGHKRPYFTHWIELPKSPKERNEK